MKKLFLFFIGLFFLTAQVYSACTHSVELRQSTDFDWWGSHLAIKVNGTTVLQNLSLGVGLFEVFYFEANTNDIIQAFFYGGTNAQNCEYTVKDEADNIIGQSGQGGTVPISIYDMRGYCISCKAPSQQTVSDILLSSAGLGWTENGDGTIWNIKWGEAGFDFDTEGTLLAGATSNPHVLSGLDTFTSCDWYVQTVCGAGDESFWTGPHAFTTQDITTAPYYESFETNSTPDGWILDRFYLGLSYMPPGDSYCIFTVFDNNFTTKKFTTLNIGPVLADMHLSFDYAHINVYSGDPPPDIGSGNFTISISNDYGQNYIDLETVDNNGIADWQHKTYDLSPHIGEYLMIKFTANRVSEQYRLFFDNISIAVPPSCYSPNILAEQIVTTDSAAISWRQIGDAGSWNIKWGETGFDFDTEGTLIEGSTTNAHALSGLIPNTTYDWYVQADCGGGDLSDWAGPKSFTTLNLASTPYFEGFATASLPEGWEVGWNVGLYPDIRPISDNYIYTVVYADGQFSKTFTTINIGPVLPDMQLSFNHTFVYAPGWTKLSKHIALDDPPNTYLHFKISISTDYGQSYTDLDIVTSEYNGWDYKLYDLNAFVGKTIKLKITAFAANVGAYYLALDNFRIDFPQTCPAPSRLTHSNLTDSSAILSWIENGTATTWNLKYGDSNFNPETEGTAINGINTNQYMLTGLEPTTNYECYVQADCGNGEKSEWSWLTAFKTAQIAAILPFTEDFENGLGEWGVANGNRVNQWHIGEATAYEGNLAAYISKDGGLTYAYYNNHESIVNLYRDIAFTENSQKFKLSFWWKCRGKSGSDRMNIHLVESSYDPVDYYPPAFTDIASNFSETGEWTFSEIEISGEYSGTNKRLIFSWINYNYQGNNPPAAIDNIMLTAVPNPEPLDWYNLQNPGSATIKEWDSVSLYAQAYKEGVTNLTGQADDIECWIGYNEENTDPISWTNWVSAVYAGDAGDNDEYKADLGIDQSLPEGTYYYASRFQYLEGAFVYGGYNSNNGGPWDSINNISGVLNVEKDTIDFVNLQAPPSAIITEGENANFYASIYVENLTPTTGEHTAIEAWIGINEENSDPSTWDESVWESAEFSNPQDNRNEYVATMGERLKPGTYYYASRFSLAGNDYVFGGYNETTTGGFWDGTDNVSGVLTVDEFKVFDFPYVQDFESIVPGWRVYDAFDYYTFVWELTTNQNKTPDGVSSFYHDHGYTQHDGQLVTPEVFIPNEGNYILTFWSYNERFYKYHKNSVLVSTGSGVPSDGDFVELWTTPSVVEPWTQTSLDLSDFAGQSIFIAFRYEGDFSHSWYVDDVVIRNTSSAIEWTGATNDDWHNAQNWNPVFVPTTFDDVNIPAGLSNYPSISSTAICKTITLESNALGTASLLDNSLLTITGNTTIQHYIHKEGYHFVSVPLTGPIGSDLFKNSSLYAYNASVQEWEDIVTDPAVPIHNTHGYMIWHSGNDTLFEFTGNYNTNDFVTATPSGPAQFQYNLVPNPYPSAIDWMLFEGMVKNHLNDAFYIRNKTTGNGSSSNSQYSSYVNGAFTNNGSRYIPAGQSFFVEADGGGIPELILTNQIRVNSNEIVSNSVPELPDLLLIKAITENGEDETVIRLHQDATPLFDRLYDASKLFTSETLPHLYSLTEDERMLSINTMALEERALVLSIGFEWSNSGDAAFNFIGLENFDPNIVIFLEDIVNGQMINVHEQQVYSFLHDESDVALRFRIHFKNVVGLTEPEPSSFQIWSNDNKVYINIPNSKNEKASIQFLDLQGKVIYQGEHYLSNPEIIHVQSNQHILIARIITGNQVYTQKVFIW